MSKPVTSKNPFFNIRPGRNTGPNREPAVVDAERHPATAKYASASGHYSPTPRMPGAWQLGYNRFGDDFEALLTGIDSLKPTVYAKTLLDLDDLWKLVGLRWVELRPPEQLAWKSIRSESKGYALSSVVNRTTPQRFADLLAWTGENRLTFWHSNSWGQAVYRTAATKAAERSQGNSPKYNPVFDREDQSVEDLLWLADNGISPDELYAVTSGAKATVAQARVHFEENMPMEYVLALTE